MLPNSLLIVLMKDLNRSASLIYRQSLHIDVTRRLEVGHRWGEIGSHISVSCW